MVNNNLPVETAIELCEQGFDPVPVEYKGKKPLYSKWQKTKITEANAHHYFNGKEMNHGILLGEGIIDIDLDDPIAIQVAKYFLPPTGMIFGRPGKRRSHYLYKSDHSLTMHFQWKDTSLLEIRAKGAQTIVPPNIHVSGEPITWEQFDECSYVNSDKIVEIAKKIALVSLLAKKYPKQAGNRDEICLALTGALIRNDYDVEETNTIVKIIAGISGDEEVNQRLKAKRTLEQLEQGGNVSGIPQLKKLLILSDEEETLLRNWMSDDVIENFSIQTQSLKNIIESQIPPRPWIYGRMLLLGHITAIIGTGGTSKSTIANAVAISLAAGKGWINQTCHHAYPVWIYNKEEDQEELDRRLKAQEKFLQLKGDPNLYANLHYQSGIKQPIILAEQNQFKKPKENKQWVEACSNFIKENNIKLWVIDPLVSIHYLDENNNMQMDFLARLLISIAQDAKCAILLVHHSNKASTVSSEEHESLMNNARGASSLLNAARIAYSVKTMSEAEAKKFGVNTRMRYNYMRLADAKNNYSLLSADATWLERTSEYINMESVPTLKLVKLTSQKENDKIKQEEEARRLHPVLLKWFDTPSISLHVAAKNLITFEEYYYQEDKTTICRRLERMFTQPVILGGIALQYKKEKKGATSRWLVKKEVA